jgi:phosphohistidine phosphatase SixA
MRVYLVQHGEFKLEEEDPQRRLTDKGIGEVPKAFTLQRPRLFGQRISASKLTDL